MLIDNQEEEKNSQLVESSVTIVDNTLSGKLGVKENNIKSIMDRLAKCAEKYAEAENYGGEDEYLQ